MGRVALRGIRAHLVRFVLSVLAVTLGVAFVAGTFSLRTMMSATFTDIVQSSMVGDAYVRGTAVAASGPQTADSAPADGERGSIPASLAAELAGVDGVAHAFPDLEGPIVLVGADGTAVMGSGAPSFAMALDPDNPTVDLVAGALPRNEREIALESATLETSGLALGDETTIVLFGELRTVTVVGDLSFGAPVAGATITFLDVATATAAFAADGQVPSIEVFADPGIDEQDLVDRISPLLATSGADAAQAVTGAAARAETQETIDESLGFVTTFLLVFAGISLFVGAYIIANTFAMSVRERMREFAMLRAVGASPTQVFASILIQAGVVGLAGSAVGIAAGVGLVSVLRVVFDRMGMALSGQVPLTVGTVATSLLIGTLVSLAAAALPARRAALTPPVEAMRDDVASAERSLRVRTIVGLAFAGAGAAAVVAAVTLADANGAVLLGLGAVGLVLGMLLLAPVIARRTLGVLAAVFVATVKPLGRLARGNVVRNPRRTANTAGALMVGMALVGAVTVLAASATVSIRSIVETEWVADFTIRSATWDVPAGVEAQVTGLDSVAAVDRVDYGTALVATDAAGAEAAPTMEIIGLPVAAFGRTLEIETVEGSLGALADGEIAVQVAAAKDNGWELGDTVTFGSDAAETTAVVGAIVRSDGFSAPILAPDDVFAEIVSPAHRAIDSLLVTAAPAATPAQLRADLVAVAAPYAVLSVLDQDDFASDLAAQVDQILVILYALLGLSVVIAILGIVNTLALSVIERTREIGLMRAVGLGRAQLAGIVTIESVLTAVFGTLVGVGVGVAVAAAMPTLFADVGLTTLAIPWGQLAAMVAAAAAVGVLAALWPAVRAARLPVLDAVAAD
ncbi:ABC transporter permease [Pengzhenrongella sicca]|uniref:FtsX-like permease family protein n=1 Tax=Pengzhenrongella sicca TaxID=2819238 RepID=A0A8A4ZCG0_9MICO|nr:ABC transporter permease [Pengzhenrongella sicca]QTE28266.1 FtsX-like permease family protein [Pengzhenrongella sicca]